LVAFEARIYYIIFIGTIEKVVKGNLVSRREKRVMNSRK
jgi:hypothetical protein